jgi:hypothetical protein
LVKDFPIVLSQKRSWFFNLEFLIGYYGAESWVWMFPDYGMVYVYKESPGIEMGAFH